MTFKKYMEKYHADQEVKTVAMIYEASQQYADMRVRQAIQSVIDYEHERGHVAISLDEREAQEFADIFTGAKVPE